MLESTIEHYLVRTVHKLGGEALKFTSPGRRHVNDRLVLLPGGKVWFIELKQPNAKPRPGQVRFYARLNELGCYWAVLDTKEKIDQWAGKGDAWREIL